MKEKNPKDSNGEPIKIGVGDAYTYWCTECDYENTFWKAWNKHGTMKKQEKSKYSPLNQPCVQCGGGPVKWKKLGEINDNM
jgi:hypothetical protein